ncbi:unnamed protein product [Gongylonema pulchrum]|uniref:Reverse transcriptase n=1 Tax=Gongylonema pulchrum TaxID=637853 RepID=A0A183E4T7_9BILA|nr:unnamed protein product [Gongylonema pulchrum]
MNPKSFAYLRSNRTEKGPGKAIFGQLPKQHQPIAASESLLFRAEAIVAANTSALHRFNNCSELDVGGRKVQRQVDDGRKSRVIIQRTNGHLGPRTIIFTRLWPQ